MAMRNRFACVRSGAARAPLAAVLACVALCAGVEVLAQRIPSAPEQPEAASGEQDKPGWAHKTFAVAAANPLATEAGYQILKAGGSAVDAAIAVQMVLTLVEPQSSGIGGGAFLLHFDGNKVVSYDGRETAPAAADEQLFLDGNGKALGRKEAIVGGRAVGVPGTVAMLEMAHRQHGKLPWARLFEPAIQLASQGFRISPRLYTLLKEDRSLVKDAAAFAYFYQANGAPHTAGILLRNPALAETLKLIAAQGSAALRQGPVAEAMVNKVRGHAGNPGKLALQDLASYEPLQRAPLCHDHVAAGRTLQLCGMGPPSSGALAIGQLLGLLGHLPPSNLDATQTLQNGVPSASFLHYYFEAAQLAFADRAQYIADPDFVAAPAGNWMSLLEPGYLTQRAQLVSQQSGAVAMKNVKAGQPGGSKTSYAPMPAQVESGTSHVSIVDGFGQAVAMTTTIEDAFGARLMVNVFPGLAGGFLLNNELTDFSFEPRDAAGLPIANRVQPGKRPRSSMSPTLVFDKTTGQLLMTLGSPGGALIIHFTAKTLLGVLHWGMLPQLAINLPNFAAVEGINVLEAKKFPPATVEALKSRGHHVIEAPLTSGLQAIARGQVHGTPLWLGGADPRREGIVMGD